MFVVETPHYIPIDTHWTCGANTEKHVSKPALYCRKLTSQCFTPSLPHPPVSAILTSIESPAGWWYFHAQSFQEWTGVVVILSSESRLIIAGVTFVFPCFSASGSEWETRRRRGILTTENRVSSSLSTTLSPNVYCYYLQLYYTFMSST